MLDIRTILRERVLLLDGGFGTMIQKFGFKEEDFRGREFIAHSQPVAGYNDILNITKPSLIKKIHSEYLSAGADIITTNTFNSNRVSLKDYGLDSTKGLVKRLNREGASLAREAIAEFENRNGKKENHFVAGSIGPTNRSSSMSPDISRPEFRNITFDELKIIYEEQIEGLIEGGADLLLFETVFDTLNLKAGLDAAKSVMTRVAIWKPIMVSATVSDRSGRILSGQSVSAFTASISEYDNVISLGLNCGFGPTELKRYIKEISENSDCFISCHPNAGLPDVNGCYNVTPEDFKREIETILNDRLVNIIGGCCGTTPEHIAALKQAAIEAKPYLPTKKSSLLQLSGLDLLKIANRNDFLIVGERCNVAGSKKFLRLIKENNMAAATEIAVRQIEEGARVIDINMDDAMLDSKEEMVNFIRYISAEPEIAKVPFMIDSSKWDVIVAALENIQGKGIVNSLSLKEGEEKFIERASRVRDLGFALIVMAFDEKGQADTYERKIEISERAFKILTEKCNYKPEDIIFDVNVMAIATGIEEHSHYAIDFIRAVKWIKENLHGARTSGGISNLSFSFRGKNRLREIMHAVFLYHAVRAGLDMAIINPASNLNYEEIDKETRDIIEDVILARSTDAETKLLNLAIEGGEKSEQKQDGLSDKNDLAKSNLSIEEQLKTDMLKGNLQDLESHLKKALQKYENPISIIEGPLMDGMKEVGDLFGAGKMFLPQVVKTARVMSKAVEYLSPYFNKNGSNSNKAGKVVIATVKGDVHDIGKNIVSTVLACNNFDVIDLGVMVPAEEILKAIKKENPDIVCLSGLITPSLAEMGNVAMAMEKAGLQLPLLVGGATTSKLHTAVKLMPLYSGKVIHTTDASHNALVVSILTNKTRKDDYLKELTQEYSAIREKYGNKQDILISFDKTLTLAGKRDFCGYITPKPKEGLNKPIYRQLDLGILMSLINWKMFFKAWDMTGDHLNGFPYCLDSESIDNWKKELLPEWKEKGEETLKLYRKAIETLNEIKKSGLFNGKAVVSFYEIKSDALALFIGEKKFPMLRQQREDSEYLSLVDFVESKQRKKDYGGLFSVTAGTYLAEKSEHLKSEGDEFESLLYQSLSDRIAEAASEWLHKEVRDNLWGYADVRKDKPENISPDKIDGIRPAWGYPMLPDQTLLKETESLLPYEELGVKITENGAMWPTSTISGIYIANPAARYFLIGKIGEDQLEEYAKERRITIKRAKEILRQ